MTEPNSRRVTGGLLEAIDACETLAPARYAALRALSVAVASGIDQAVADGDLARLGTLTYRLTVLLRELRLTPDTQPVDDEDGVDALIASLSAP